MKLLQVTDPHPVAHGARIYGLDPAAAPSSAISSSARPVAR